MKKQGIATLISILGWLFGIGGIIAAIAIGSSLDDSLSASVIVYGIIASLINMILLLGLSKSITNSYNAYLKSSESEKYARKTYLLIRNALSDANSIPKFSNNGGAVSETSSKEENEPKKDFEYCETEDDYEKEHSDIQRQVLTKKRMNGNIRVILIALGALLLYIIVSSIIGALVK